ncbi:tyrosine transporter [Capsaspora owczarzaki ATCC 30864]|uniref:tyrosine transporter n=1 Tax=Capsaspora owczarzaki (strain ATCC 30864) TaxID=595528 RepID=UPI0003526407|nr:tyrosine transporter [Capsaspora owczarzaki ATCC 30864]|eukprot:XP_004343150.2 tyrosine transporter [Capsaspora owczarzaki ATCC 30864]
MSTDPHSAASGAAAAAAAAVSSENENGELDEFDPISPLHQHSRHHHHHQQQQQAQPQGSSNSFTVSGHSSSSSSSSTSSSSLAANPSNAASARITSVTPEQQRPVQPLQQHQPPPSSSAAAALNIEQQQQQQQEELNGRPSPSSLTASSPAGVRRKVANLKKRPSFQTPASGGATATTMTTTTTTTTGTAAAAAADATSSPFANNFIMDGTTAATATTGALAEAYDPLNDSIAISFGSSATNIANANAAASAMVGNTWRDRANSDEDLDDGERGLNRSTTFKTSSGYGSVSQQQQQRTVSRTGGRISSTRFLGEGTGADNDDDDNTPLLRPGTSHAPTNANAHSMNGMAMAYLGGTVGEVSEGPVAAKKPPGGHGAGGHAGSGGGHGTKHGGSRWASALKTIILLGCFIAAAVIFTANDEMSESSPMYAISSNTSAYHNISVSDPYDVIGVHLIAQPGQHSPDELFTVTFHLWGFSEGVWSLADTKWVVNVSTAETSGDTFINVDKEHEFEVTGSVDALRLVIGTDSPLPVAVSVKVIGHPYFIHFQVAFAATILLGVYVLIIFEIIHRTLAAMFGSFFTLGILAILNKRPALTVIVAWIDYETVCLLFGMMTMVGIFSETGFFEYAAVKAYKFSKGKVWYLVTMLCMFSTIVSAFLDNVTTILIMTPVCIRLCEVLNLDPLPVLIAQVLFSNIGGTATAVGDPPNVLIVANKQMSDNGINFTNFTLHMMVGVIFVTAACYGMLRFMYRHKNLEVNDSPEVAELKREIVIWRRAAAHVSGASSHEESHVRELLDKKVLELNEYLARASQEDMGQWEINTKQLEAQYKVRNFPLFINSCLVLGISILFFFLHSLPEIHLDLGWIAILGALALLLLSNNLDMEHILAKVEWGTLLFFAALFILMEGLSELGLITFIGDQTATLIKSVDPDSRLTVAIIIILWVSGLASAFIDNIPFTTAMIPVVTNLATDPDVGLPLGPLVWALAFGACLGGNGTLIGASANVVCAGLSEQHGYPISFLNFFKTGFPIMIVSLVVATIYLLIAHSWLGWQ